MNISFGWIDELADLPEPLRDPRALAEYLTMTAVAVEKTERVGEGLDAIVVARVLEVGPHPNADRLSLCKVDRGDGAPLDVVCGAPAIVRGALYPHVAPGGTLPDGFRIESREIRGELSHGMLCSEVELELGRDKGGIMRLSDDLKPGTSLGDALGLPDTRFTLDLNPNRVDLACHIGVAREVAAGGVTGIRERDFGGPTWRPDWKDGGSHATGAGVTVRIEAPDRCSRYLAAVIRGVKVGPSPAWLAGRLLSVGARSINNIVDATNYVMLELNQPLHAFDLHTLAGDEVRVRAAAPGETLVTLDGEEHELTAASTLIADRDRPIALAGVMGGRETEVTSGTVDLLIECAAFEPMGVRATRSVAALSTDASYRFERGIDVHAQTSALTRCVELILAIAGGEADSEAIRVGPGPAMPNELVLRVGRVNQVLGLGLDGGEILRTLAPIGLEAIPSAEPEAAGLEGEVRISVPGWRTDLTREIDLVEEVARRVGFETFPEKDRRFRRSVVPEDKAVARAGRVRRALVRRGLLEARSLSFMPEDFRGNRAIVAVPNPLSAEESYLRAAMVPVLLRRVEHNFSRGRRDVRLFEIGTVFYYASDVPAAKAEKEAGGHRFAETGRFGLVVTGGRNPDHWSEETADVDVWDLKGLAEELAEGLCGATLEPYRANERGSREEGAATPLAGPWLAEGGFQAVRDGRVVGVAGAVDARSLDAPPWAAAVFALEFELEAVQPRGRHTYRETSPFPSVRRDLSVTVPVEVEAAAVEQALRSAASDLLESIRLFDVYTGGELGDRRRALGWAFRFRAHDRTLTDEDVESEMTTLSAVLEERFDARIRKS